MTNDDLLKDLVADALELLEKIESDLLQLETLLHRETTGVEQAEFKSRIALSLQNLFRNFHTLKGTAGFFELPTLVRVAHRAEDLLSIFRSNPEKLEVRAIEGLLACRDFLARLVDAVASTGHDREFLVPAGLLLERLDALFDRADEPVPPSPSPPAQPEATEPPRFGLFHEPAESAEKATGLPGPGKGSPGSGREESHSDQTRSIADIRITTGKLDELMDLVGELVIAESMVREEARTEGRKTAEQLGRIVRGIQETVLGMRMIPVDGLFRKITRLTRDLSQKTGREVRLEIHGEETEIDRTLVEGIADPLVHIVRNAFIHGLEKPDERESIGKPREGLIEIEARTNGNEVWISIADDGRGLQRETILSRARELDLIAADDLLEDAEIWNLVFAPGFSTAREVSQLSGRGVGLDVVQKNIHALKGRVEVRSRPGEGTTFILKIPLTLAIIDGMVARVGRVYFVIPTDGINRSLSVAACRIHFVSAGQRAIRLGERLVPVFQFDEIFSFFGENHKGTPPALLIVIERRGRAIGLFVDEILGNQHAVIKPLPAYLSRVPALAGCTILGNGSVSLILDISVLVERFGARPEGRSGDEFVEVARVAGGGSSR